MKQNYFKKILIVCLLGMAFQTYGQLSFSSTPVTDATVGVPYTYSAFASDGTSTNPVLSCLTKPDWLNFASNGSTSMETFGPSISYPAGIAGDSEGNTYVVSLGGSYIYKIYPDGTANTSWAAVDYGNIYAMNIEGDYLYVSYYYNSITGSSCIKRIDLTNPAGGQTMVYDTGFQNRLLSLVFKDGYIYSASYGSNQVLKIDPSTGISTEYVSIYGPFGLGFNSAGVLYIASYVSGTVSSYDGSILTTEVTGLSDPSDVKIDLTGNIYVSSYQGGIVKYNETFSTSNWIVPQDYNNSIWGMNLSPMGSLNFALYRQQTCARIGTGGVLSGTPGATDVGDHNVTIRASNGSEVVDQSFVITVSDTEAPAPTGSITITNDSSDPASDWLLSDGRLIPLVDGAKVNVNEVVNTLASGDLVIEAETDVIFDAAAVPALSAARTLTLKAGKEVILNPGTKITASGNKLNLVFWSDADGNEDGMIWLRESSLIGTNGGHLWIGGGDGTASWNGLTVGDGFAQAKRVLAPTELLQINNQNYSYQNGITLDKTSLTTGEGDLSLNGKVSGISQAESMGYGQIGVYFNRGNTISTTSGNIQISGTTEANRAAESWFYGILLASDRDGEANIIQSESGEIKLEGVSSQSYDGNFSGGVGIFEWNSGINEIRSVSGDINIYGHNKNNINASLGAIIAMGGGPASTRIYSQSGNIHLLGKSDNPDAIGLNLDSDIRVGKDGTDPYSGAITLEADIISSLKNSSRFSSSGSLFIKPVTSSAAVGIGGALGTLQLPASYFTTNFEDGFSEIVIGDEKTGKITVDGTLVYNDPLTLKTNGSIVFTPDAGVSSTSANALTLWSRASGNNEANDSNFGAIWMQQGSSINTAGGNLTMGGGSDPNIGYAMGDPSATSAENNAIYRGVAMNGAVNAAGGNIIINGKGSSNITHTRGVNIAGPIVTEGSGNITVRGIGRGASDAIALGDSYFNPDAVGTLRAQTGDITLDGKPSSSIRNGLHVSTTGSYIQTNGNFSATTTGRITATAGALNIGGNTHLEAADNITMTHTTNDFVGPIVVTVAANLHVTDENELTLGEVSTNGTIEIAAQNGDLTIAGNVSTTNATADAIQIFADKDRNAGDPLGGNIHLSGTPEISTGSGGQAKLYSGSILESADLITLIGEENVRYNVDANTTIFDPVLGSGNYALIREKKNSPPTAVCQNFVAQLGADGTVTISPADVDGGSSDAEGDVTLSFDKEYKFDCSDVGTSNEVTLIVTDSEGETDTCTAIVTVEDNTPPTVLAQDVTVYLDENGQASIRGDYSVGAVAGQLGAQNSSATSTPVDCDCPEGYVAVGYEGFTGWILDDFRLVCKEVLADGSLGTEIVETCFSGSNTSVNRSIILAGNDVLVGVEIQDGDYSSQQSSRTHVSIKGIGKSLPQIANGELNTIENTMLPALSGSGTSTTNLNTTTQFAPAGHAIVGMSVNQSTGYSATVSFKYAPISSLLRVENGSSDNCSIASISVDRSEFTCDNLGANTVTLNVTDINGNTSSATSTVTVEDVDAPVLTAEADQEVVLDTECSITVPNLVDGSVATDNCTVSITQSPAAGTVVSSLHNGTVEVVVTATDAAGNKDESTVVLTAIDDESPVLTAEADQEVVLDTECSISVPNLVDGSSATDNCTVTITQSPAPGTVVSSEHNGTVEVVVTATDAAGNKDESTVVLTAIDNEAPVLTAEADQEVVLDADCGITVPNLVDGSEATDNCTVTITQLPAAGTVVSSEHNGTVEVIVTATDAAGNKDESTVVLTAIDDQAPVLTAEADQEVVLDADCSITVPNLVDGSEATDNCTVSITQSPAAGTVVSSEHNGTVEVIVTATDAAGNKEESTVVLTAIDNEAPVLTAEADQEVVLDVECSITVPNLVDGSEATDNCTVTITQSPAAGTVISSEHNGTVEVVVTATDAAGNTDESTVVLTAIDNEAPVLTAEADQEVVLDVECSITVPNLVDGSEATDNCTVSITQSPAAGTVISSEHNGTVEVVVTATDAAGNTDESTVVLTAIDNEAPVLTAEADQEVVLDTECSISVPNLVDGSVATDNCTVSITQSPAAGTVVSSEHNGTVDVVVTATDAAGNRDEATVVLTAKDNESPVLTAEAHQDVSLDEFCSITVPDVMGTATDNCTVTITQSPAVGTIVSSEHNGTVDVVVTATDAAGNTDESTVVLTAKDNESPVLTAEADQDVNLDEFCSITVPDVMGTATDNCTVSITQSPAAGTVVSSEHNGTVDVMVTATDAAGNIAESTVVLTAKDKIAPTPVMETLAPVRAECIVEAADVAKPLAVDNCDESIEGVADLYFPVTRGGSTIITWKYDDGNGNVTYQQQEIIIEDTTAPVPDVAALEDIVVECGVSDIPAPTATDNCRGAITGTTSDALTYMDQGDYTITWTYDDENGNITTQQQNVIVRDVTAPEVSTRDITVYLDPETNVSITPEDIDDGSFDNCSELILSLDQSYFDEVGTYEVTLSATDEAGNTGEATATVNVEIDGVDAKAVHVVPTILKQSSMAKVVVPFRSKIMQVEVLETETNKYKVFEGNKSFEMMIDIAPFKGTLLVRVMDEDGTVHLKKLIAL